MCNSLNKMDTKHQTTFSLKLINNTSPSIVSSSKSSRCTANQRCVPFHGNAFAKLISEKFVFPLNNWHRAPIHAVGFSAEDPDRGRPGRRCNGASFDEPTATAHGDGAPPDDQAKSLPNKSPSSTSLDVSTRTRLRPERSYADADPAVVPRGAAPCGDARSRPRSAPPSAARPRARSRDDGGPPRSSSSRRTRGRTVPFPFPLARSSFSRLLLCMRVPCSKDPNSGIRGRKR